jgi:putative ABC transport system permease protein
MRLYLGNGSGGILAGMVPLAASAVIFLLVVLSCLLILRRIQRVSAVEALRAGSSEAKSGSARILPLSAGAALDVNVFLGMRDVVQRFRFFALLCFIFFFSSCIILLPVHFLSTINSPGFVSYMGIGRSDIRIDLRHSETVEQRYEELLAYVEEDEQVERYAPLVTSQFTLIAENGERETIAVESGDFSTFPLEYLHGEAPGEKGEIALSYLYSRDMGKDTGDHLTLLVDGRERRMEVSGIYQDVTDGGRTAKASLPYNREAVLWYTLSMDLVPGSDVEQKQAEYAELFYPARVTDMESYIAQTLGNTISQLKMVTAVTIAVGVAVAVLITSLFLTMLLKKDAPQIAVMRSIGFSLADLRRRYLSTAATLLIIGVLTGTLFSNTIGSRLVGLVWGTMGAPQISFVIDPLRAYLLLPLLLFGAVAVTTLLSMGAMKNHTLLR